MSGDIEIKSHAGFNQLINNLDQANGQVSGKKDSAETVTEAVSKANTNGESGAPVFSATMEALSSMMEDVKGHVASAQRSVGNAVSDLRSLNTGMAEIDGEGEQKVITA